MGYIAKTRNGKEVHWRCQPWLSPRPKSHKGPLMEHHAEVLFTHLHHWAMQARESKLPGLRMERCRGEERGEEWWWILFKCSLVAEDISHVYKDSQANIYIWLYFPDVYQPFFVANLSAAHVPINSTLCCNLLSRVSLAKKGQVVGYITRTWVESAAKSTQNWRNVCGMDGGQEKVGREEEATGRITTFEADSDRGRPHGLGC